MLNIGLKVLVLLDFVVALLFSRTAERDAGFSIWCPGIDNEHPDCDTLAVLFLQQLSQVIRTADRENLFVILGNRKTATAQTVLSVQRASISFAYDQLIPEAKNEDLDYIIIDTSPSVGELQEQALWAADGVLIPCAVDYLASDGVFNIAVTLKRIHEDFDWQGGILGILPTFYDDVTRESKATLEDLKERFNHLLLKPIHRATILRECAVEGKTIYELAPTSRAAEQYRDLVQFVLNWKKDKNNA